VRLSLGRATTIDEVNDAAASLAAAWHSLQQPARERAPKRAHR